VSESVFADDDVGREADGGGVPVVEGIDVVHGVLVGTDGAGGAKLETRKQKVESEN
jgi:hypothetical protein